ncbi:MAG: non-canonical purine NTP pyrophosphatase [Persicimonas sp.]
MLDKDDTFLFATGNPGKRREFESLLGDFLNPNWRVFDLESWHDQLPEIEEDKETFWENALKKAYESSQITHSVALSDDSGLEVDALDGRPGVYSARYAGPDATDADNNRKLIAELDGVPFEERTARYVCVAALAMPNNKTGRALVSRTGVPFEEIGESKVDKEAMLSRIDDRVVIWFRGTVEGRIIDEPRGTGGFGYDPHFYVPQWDKTMAEVSLDKKNSISHRAEALRKMAQFFAGNP